MAEVFNNPFIRFFILVGGYISIGYIYINILDFYYSRRDYKNKEGKLVSESDIVLAAGLWPSHFIVECIMEPIAKLIAVTIPNGLKKLNINLRPFKKRT